MADFFGIQGGSVTYHYDDNGRVQRQTLRGAGGTIGSDYYYISDNELPNGGYDAVGNLLGYTVVAPNRAPKDYGRYSIKYSAFDTYKEVSHSVDNGAANVSSYDINGNRTSVTTAGRVVGRYWYDATGKVQSKVDYGTAGNGEAKPSFALIVNDQVLGYEDNDRNNILGSTYASATSMAQASPPSSYTVLHDGETLQSIAQAVWGDSKLWYLIADTNGLSAGETLRINRVLNLPSRVNTVHNDYATYKPYNASEAIGNTAPALPPPTQPGGGCGGVGMIIMIVVAIAVTYITAGAAANAIFAAYSGAATTTAAAAAAAGSLAGSMSVVAGGVIGAAAGSIASQVVGISIGAQDGFSWSAVAQAGIAGGVTAGIGQLAAFDKLAPVFQSNEWSGVAARAALSNTVSQGIGMVTGLQHGFNWSSVAASYAGAAVGSQVAGYLESQKIFGDPTSAAAKFATAGVSGFSAGLTTSVMRGGKIAIAQITADAFGNALGSSLAGAMSGGGDRASNRSTSSAGSNLLAKIEQGQFDAAYPQASLTAEADARRDAMADAGLIPSNSSPQMSYAPGFGSSSARQSFINVGGSYDYQTQMASSDGEMMPVVTRTRHIGADEYVGNLQNRVNDFSYEMDDIASAGGSSTGARVFAAATYGVRKIAADTVNSLISLPRLLTSDTMVPGIVNAVANPLQAGRSFARNFGNMSLQDKFVTGLELGLPFKASIESLAGRIPGAGGYLAGDLGYSSGKGVTLSANGKLYGFIGDGLSNQTAGPYAYQSGAVGGIRFSELGTDTEFLVAQHGDMPSPRPGQNSHHGVMSAWMKVNFPEYDPNLAPAVLMPEANHRATFGVYNTWRAEARAEMGGTFSWSTVPETHMQSLSEKMFDAAKVPSTTRQEYWDWYGRMKGALTK
ncbi:hypothetical protein ACFOLJ_24740 [Rugamonas sp. CCM 8940]|uniref:hypothetical protein n=1 Tax=Rugamonas sp. CCM 8940 TaxID=2765359 RepID=UPI0018F74B26|nr:hypothetical protein [Rugamonas sp. CCM 8940]MBJ7313188.1 hypothetical protein [Rugamonas sp. CCM 8940]